MAGAGRRMVRAKAPGGPLGSPGGAPGPVSRVPPGAVVAVAPPADDVVGLPARPPDWSVVRLPGAPWQVEVASDGAPLGSGLAPDQAVLLRPEER